MICLSLGKCTPGEAMKMAKDAGFIELRADLLHWATEDYVKLIQSCENTVFTFRPGDISDDERFILFEAAVNASATYIDVEIESDQDFLEKIKDLVAHSNTDLIISYHNYEATPETDELESILQDCYLKGADVAKIACRTYSHADAARLLALYAQSGRKVILGMGHAGKITRVASLMLGAEFTFASPGEGSETAQGQISFKLMQEIYNLLQ